MKRGVRDECLNRELAHSPLATLKKREGNWVLLTFAKTSGIGLRTGKKKYRKIPKISPRGLYFSKALFEGLIFGGAYVRRGLSMEGNLRFKINWASLIVGRKFTVFALFSLEFEGNFQVQTPGELIFGGAI